MSGMVTHLWSSTLVLALALLLARALPLTARTRYAVLFFGLLKFAIPAAVIVAPWRALGLDRQVAGTIVMEWVGAPAPLRAIAPPPSTDWPQVLLMAWLVSAFALAAAWAIARSRLVGSALAASSPASPREQAALAAARRQLALRAAVDVTRSTICEAPAVVRIIRPVIVLPEGGCDMLDDAELESLLRHECAHVARRDNLLGVVESGIVAAFWFHPLVWFAQRAIATAREEACDETAAAAPDSIDIYLSALSKVCRAVLAERLAGVSCMASAHLKERLNYLMAYEGLRKRALSHRFTVAISAVAVILITGLTGLDAVALSEGATTPFTLNFTARPGDLPNQIEFTGRVYDTKSGLVLTRPAVSFIKGTGAHIATTADGRQIEIAVKDNGSLVTATLRVSENGQLQQETAHVATLEADGPRNKAGRRYTGDKISLNLKDAKLTDVLRQFGALTGLEITTPPDLDGRVNLDIKDMPWDQAFDLILRENRLTYQLQGNKLVILRE